MVFAGLLLVAGSLADRFGRKRFFLGGLTIFAAGSIGAALSSSVELLISFRGVMGPGQPWRSLRLSIINEVFHDPSQRARAIGAWGGTIGLGITLGPITGGLLLSRFWWGSIFMVNIPIAVAAFAGALVVVPDSKNPAAERPDPAGLCGRSQGSGCSFGRSSKLRPGDGPLPRFWVPPPRVSPSSPVLSFGNRASATQC